MDFECVVDARARLGEGPLWDPREKVLWWVDIKAREIHRYDPSTRYDHVWPAPDDVGCLAVREGDGLIVALRSGLHFFDPTSGQFDLIVHPEADCMDNRFNDGKSDRQGRFWPGSMYEGPKPKPSGSLYRLGSDLTCRQMINGVFCSNGLAWSPDSKVMYFADSLVRRVWAWDFDAVSGEIENPRLFIDTAPLGSNPDGATVDRNGNYWLALPEADKIGCFDPKGAIIELIDLPAPHPTCVMFGGADLDVLYITTATMFRSSAELSRANHAGGVFALNVGTKGLPEAFFRG